MTGDQFVQLVALVSMLGLILWQIARARRGE